MTEKLYVHVDLGNGEIVLAGQLIVNREGRTGSFKYARSYCANPEAYSLDPINLPLIEGSIFESPMTRDHMGIAGVLLDAGPDSWGKKVLTALLDPPPSNDLEFLLAGSGQGTGTLYFSQTRNQAIGQSLPREFGDLEEVLEIALLIDEGLEVPQEKAMFFQYGSSIGGIRPKTFIDERIKDKDGELKWRRWIVKFPRKGDLVDNCLLEHASMVMAREAGITVPETKILHTALGAVLLVERFDIDKENRRAHVISAESLINKPDIAKITSEESSYASMGRIAKQISDSGLNDNEELFRRMIFNVAIGNVDDHLKNHSFYKPAGHKSLRLTPAYDVLPTIGMHGSVQAISVGPLGCRQSLDNLTLGAEEMGIAPETAIKIVAEVAAATSDWQDHYANQGLSLKEISVIGKCFAGRDRIMTYLDSLSERERERMAKSNSAFSIGR